MSISNRLYDSLSSMEEEVFFVTVRCMNRASTEQVVDRFEGDREAAYPLYESHKETLTYGFIYQGGYIADCVELSYIDRTQERVLRYAQRSNCVMVEYAVS